MHRHLVHRLTVGFRVLQQNREAKIEVEHDTDLATSKNLVIVFSYGIHTINFVFSDIETPVLATTRRESFSTFSGSPVSSVGADFSLPRQPSQSQGKF